MKRTLILLVLSVLTLCPFVSSAEKNTSIQLVSPADGETVYMPHPHFRWEKESDAGIEDRYRIQISRDEEFSTPVVDDSLDVVSRYVCARPLPPDTYFWRVGRAGETSWSKTFRFTRDESTEYRIKAGATQGDIATTIAEAAANTPAKVIFEPGNYRITETIPLRGVKDLILDGAGSTLTLETFFLDLRNCANLTLQNMTVRPAREPSTLVDIKAVALRAPKPSLLSDVFWKQSRSLCH